MLLYGITHVYKLVRSLLWNCHLWCKIQLNLGVETQTFEPIMQFLCTSRFWIYKRNADKRLKLALLEGNWQLLWLGQRNLVIFDIATTRLNRPCGRYSENHKSLIAMYLPLLLSTRQWAAVRTHLSRTQDTGHRTQE